ncbi:MAG: serine hydroxymethyltransferase [Planctomycetota bacterium]
MTSRAPSDPFSTIRQTDSALAELLDAEDGRQSGTLTLIASENHCSTAVRQALASRLTDKYAEGYPAARYYGGCEVADAVESLAIERARKIFGAEHANVQPHSGSTANLAVLEALVGAKGKILGMALKDGGHLTHGHKASATGRLFEAVQYGIDPASGRLDYDAIADLAKQHRPAVLIAGASSYPRTIDWATLAGIARGVGAMLMADIAHPAGLVAGGAFPSPVGFADVITMTTHKTLRGPRGGMVLCRADLAKKIDSGVFPGAQGGPLMHSIAAKAVAFGEVLSPQFRSYAAEVVANARHLADRLLARGLAVVTGGTDSHMVVVDLRAEALSGADVEERCKVAALAVNKNMVPNDPRSPRVTSGIRIGTAAATTRKMGPAAFDAIAEVLVAIVRGEDPARHRGVIAELCTAHPLP